MILILGIALFINIRFKKQLNTLIPATINAKENILLFITGALIYSGTFLIGNNWDYRNTFLLLTIPLLIDIRRKMKIITINILN